MLLTVVKCHLGSPVRENCTPGSAWGDENKRPCLLGEASARKRLRPQGSAQAKVVKTRLYQPLRPLGKRLAPERGARRGDCRTLCGRHRLGLSVSDGRRPLPGKPRGAVEEVRTGVHPDKTRRIEFGRFAEPNRKKRGEGKPETFDFLGLTHISGKDRNGNFSLKRKTIAKRMRAKLQEIKQELRRRMHDPVEQTGKWLKSVMQGYFNYHAVPGNLGRLKVFHRRVQRLWRWALRRRGQPHRPSWARILRLTERWLPKPRVLHPYPGVRFAASHPR